MSYVDEVFEQVKRRDPNQPEFHQAVWEVLESLAPVESFANRIRNVRRAPPLDLPYECIAYRGDVPRLPSARGWRRWLGFTKKRPWQFWVLRQAEQSLFIENVIDAGADATIREQVEQILSSLSLAEKPAEPPEVFANRVRELARLKFPLLESETTDDFQLKLGDSSINLFNFYRAYLNEPDRFDEIILPALTTIVQVQEWGEDQTAPPLEDVEDRIMPMLYPREVWEQRFPNFIGQPWVADLMILYVVDETRAYWYVREDLLEKWGLDRQELHALALRNLDAYFQRNTMEFALAGEDDGPRLLMPNRADAYNTSRILSESFHRKLQEYLGREFAVGIPSRDFFVACSLDSPETLAQIRDKVAEDFSSMDHPMSERLLLVSCDGVSELCTV